MRPSRDASAKTTSQLPVPASQIHRAGTGSAGSAQLWGSYAGGGPENARAARALALVAAGPDSALWYSEEDDNLIGRITTAGIVTAQYVLPTANSHPQRLVLGSDGALWFTEDGGNRIGRLTTTGSYSEFAIPGGAATPSQTSPIAAGFDGALWFATAGSIVRAGFQ